MIIIGIIWFAASIYAIYVADRKYLWDNGSKTIIITSLITLVFNGFSVYNPELNKMVGGVIEINPSWNTALILAIIEGIMITGPIAAIYSYKTKKRIDNM